MLIKSIWLKVVELIPPKRLSSPKIVYTLCLVNKSNFPITHTMMFVILKVSMKWRLFDRIPFNEIPMGSLIIVKSRSETFCTTYVLFRTCFAWKEVHNIIGTIPPGSHPFHLTKFSWQIQSKPARDTYKFLHPVLHSQYPHISCITITNIALHIYSCGAYRYI